MATVYTFVPSPNHMYPDHPERPGRLEILAPRLGGIDVEQIEAKPARPEEVAFVHNPKLVAAIEKVCRESAPGIIDYAPTYVSRSSYEDALRAVGGTLSCVRAVIQGNAKNAYAIVRPPGHHAEPQRAMGFCIFNNIAVAARDALEHGMERVAIIDYDAHHGNGTQAAFQDEERVAFLSTHQWGIYPGTGGIDDTPQARKRVVNVPLPAFAGDQVFAQIADRIFEPYMQSFRPQMLLVSVGFDAHWNDPLTSLGLSSAGYLMLAKRMVSLAEEYCEGRLVFVLEGGYDPLNVANGSQGVFVAATGRGRLDVQDPSPRPEPDCDARIEEVRTWHGF
jgi:acetoin utilization deacetylase AcuC-like enzyme